MLLPKFRSLKHLEKTFPDEQSCIDYLEKVIWNGKPVCPFCSNSNSEIYKCKNNQYKCKNTGKSFNIKTGTIFKNSNLPLREWFRASYLFSVNKKGISSYQLSDFIDTTQKSAWFVLHRLRRGTDCLIFKTALEGTVEIDETFIGGKNKNRHRDKKVPQCQGRSWKDKTPVLAMIEKRGNAISRVVPNTQRKTLEPIIRTNVKEGSNVYTDEWKAYRGLSKWYNHEIVIHRIKQYVNGNASTNSAESFNACIKRGYNTYHWISKKHVQRYVNEFTFRYNTRKYSVKDRFDLLLLSTVGKQITYQQLIS